MSNPRIDINQVPIEWDTERGTFTFFGLPSTLFWINPSLLTLLRPIAREVGVDLFRLMVAHSASQGTDEDFHAMVSTLGDEFTQGFLNWGKAVSGAGWGTFELPHFDPVNKLARVRISNTWELLLDAGEDERWGCPFIQGKIIGIFSHAFGTTCWADQVAISYDPDDAYIEFQIYESRKTIELEIEAIRRQRRSDQERKLQLEVERKTADLIVVNKKLGKTTEELQDAHETLRTYADGLEKKVQERTDHLDRANRRLQETQKDLLIENNVKNKLFSIIAHDLKSPLGAILTTTEVMDHLKDGLSREKLLDYAEKVHETASQVHLLLDNLLEWAQLQLDDHSVHPEVFDIRALVDEVVRLLGPVAEKKSIALKTDLAPRTVYADRNAMASVVRNLVTNSIKFTPANGSIDISAEEAAPFLEIAVRDTGVGMTADQIKEIFALHQKTSTRGTEGETGTGLGLPMCKQLVETCGGEIRAESRPGEGTTLFFTLPLQAPQ
jgi:signal transduction histidine kinase